MSRYCNRGLAVSSSNSSDGGTLEQIDAGRICEAAEPKQAEAETSTTRQNLPSSLNQWGPFTSSIQPYSHSKQNECDPTSLKRKIQSIQTNYKEGKMVINAVIKTLLAIIKQANNIEVTKQALLTMKNMLIESSPKEYQSVFTIQGRNEYRNDIFEPFMEIITSTNDYEIKKSASSCFSIITNKSDVYYLLQRIIINTATEAKTGDDKVKREAFQYITDIASLGGSDVQCMSFYYIESIVSKTKDLEFRKTAMETIISIADKYEENIRNTEPNGDHVQFVLRKVKPMAAYDIMMIAYLDGYDEKIQEYAIDCIYGMVEKYHDDKIANRQMRASILLIGTNRSDIDSPPKEGNEKVYIYAQKKANLIEEKWGIR